MKQGRIGDARWRASLPGGTSAWLLCLAASACGGSSGNGGSSAADSAGGTASTQSTVDGGTSTSASQGTTSSQATSTSAAGGAGARGGDAGDGGAGGADASSTDGGVSGAGGSDTTSTGGVGPVTSGGGAGGVGGADGGTSGVGGSIASTGGVAGQSSSGGSGGVGGAGGTSGNVCDPGPEGCGEPVMTIPVAGCGICGNVVLVYQLDEATDERLSFTFQLRARLFGSVPLSDIEVHYYFSQEEDSPWQASVDSYVQHGPDVDLTSSAQISIAELDPTLDFQTHFIRIRNDSTAELAEADDAGEPYLEVHVTLEPSDTGAPNQVHDDDWSYQANTTDFRDNLGMGVFVCEHLASGCTPGQSNVGE